MKRFLYLSIAAVFMIGLLPCAAAQAQTPVNLPPVAPDAKASIFGWPTANDYSYFEVPVQDPEGDPLTIINIVQTNTRTQGVVSAYRASCSGPNDCYAAFNYVSPVSHPAAMSFTFTYQVNDGTSDSNVATVTLLVGDIPLAMGDDMLAAQYPGKTTITLEGGKLGDVELTFGIVTQPAHGQINTPTTPVCALETGFMNGSFLTFSLCRSTVVYTPDPGYTDAADRFTFDVSDGVLDSAPGTIDLWVASNSAPTANPGSATVSTATPVYVPLTATDPDEHNYTTDDLTFFVDAGSADGGTLGTPGEPDCTQIWNGSNYDHSCTSYVLYTPKPGTTADADSFSFHVNDTHQDSASATISLDLHAPLTWHVNVNDDVVEANGCDAVHCSLREAVNAALAGDTIDFTLSLPNTITLAGQLQITIAKDITISGPGADQLAISGGATTDPNDTDHARVFDFYDNGRPMNASLTGLQIKDGRSGEGGGIFVESGAIVTVSDSVIGPNNIVTYAGGGIANMDGTLTLIRSTVVGNHGTGTYGGAGIFNNGGVTTLINSTVSGNVTNNYGGGILAAYGGKVSLIHSTVSNNTANENYLTEAWGGAGGLSARDDGYFELQNSLVAGNTDLTGLVDPSNPDYHVAWPDISGSFISLGGNLIGNGTGSTGWISGDKVGTAAKPIDPKLDALAVNAPGHTPTYALLEGSPAIDAVACLAAVTTDQRGVDRPQRSACDIGAFEVKYDMSVDSILLGYKVGSSSNTLTGSVTIRGSLGSFLSKAAVTVDWYKNAVKLPMRSSPTASTNRNGVASFTLRGMTAGTYKLCVTNVAKPGWGPSPWVASESDCKTIVVPTP